jgi:arylsulfatase A-like enzyme
MLSALVLTACLTAPNIVVISVDTLRADHLGFYGHPHDTSPNLDNLAEDSLVFDDMICEIPLTSPSMASMMTSRYPRMTGATRNGLPLPEDVPTAAQIFQEAGYETMCVTSNWTLKRTLSGLDRGFDVYDDSFKQKRWGILKSERDADDVSRIALDLLQKRDPSKPLFAWFHYSDPHAPYENHRKFSVSKRSDYPDDPGAKIKVRYDSEIAFTDNQIKLVLDALPKEDTYIVFIGDHGESIEEHKYLGHGRRIHQTGLHIPFMIAGPNIDAGRTDVPVRGVDLAPTLLALAQLTKLPGAVGMDVLNDDVDLSRKRVIETYGGAVPNFSVARLVMAGKNARRMGIISDGWKLITNDDEKELFDLTKDPGELNDLADTYPELAKELNDFILEWDKHIPRNAQETDLSQEDIEALKSLGYID